MSSRTLRPEVVIGGVAGLLLVIILAMFALGRGGEEEPVTIDTNRLSQELGRLRVIGEQLGGEVPTLKEQLPIQEWVKENLGTILDSLALDHGVEIRSQAEGDAEAVDIGGVALNKLDSNLEFVGPRKNVIAMLLEFRSVFGGAIDAMELSNVSVVGGPEEWEVKLVLTQYFRT